MPAPIDVQVFGPNAEANRKYAIELLQKISLITGVADARIQQAFNAPTLNVAVDRVQASQVNISEKDVATSLQDTLAGSIQTAPTFWLDPNNGSLSDRRPDAAIWVDSLSNLENIPASQGDSSQILGSVAKVTRGFSNAVVSHYAVQPVIDIFADRQSTRSGSGIDRHIENSAGNEKGLARRRDRCATRADDHNDGGL